MFGSPGIVGNCFTFYLLLTLACGGRNDLIDDMRAWLAGLGLAKYGNAFADNDIGLGRFSSAPGH